MSAFEQDQFIIGKHKSEIETPALLLYADRLERNIDKMAAFFSKLDCNLRPHFKTHRLPFIAHKQIRAGAHGITCAKISEAKILVESGIRDVLIANQIIGERKIEQLAGLAHHSEIIVAVDDIQNVSQMSSIALKRGVKINILIEIDVGLNRCGVNTDEKALTLARSILNLKGVNLRGLMGYEGHAVLISDYERKKRECEKANARLVKARNFLEKNGIHTEIVSAGGTGTYDIASRYPGITEVQAGSYATMDTQYRKVGTDFEMALSLMATIISHPTKEKFIVDAGLKSLTNEAGMPEIVNAPGAMISTFCEEHIIVMWKNASRDWK
jgi:D-serine deaminase-like pyridoxal phosphate-dependent protein